MEGLLKILIIVGIAAISGLMGSVLGKKLHDITHGRRRKW